MSLYPAILLLACVLYVTASPQANSGYNKLIRPTYNPNKPPRLIQPTYRPYNPTNKPAQFLRVRRFVDGNQRFDGQNPTQQKRPDWEVKPDLSRDQRGNTRGEITVQKHGDNHDVEAGWGQNIRGPDKHSGTWHVGGSVRW